MTGLSLLWTWLAAGMIYFFKGAGRVPERLLEVAPKEISPEAKLAAAVRVKLERRGKPIGPHDLLIAATALSNNAVLVTNNTKEFSRIPKLQLQNWYA